MGDRLGILGAVGLLFSHSSLLVEPKGKQKECPGWGSNSRPSDYETDALPTALPRLYEKGHALVGKCEIFPVLKPKTRIASAGNRTRVNCLEGSYAHHYTTNAQVLCTPRGKWRKVLRKRLLKLECVYSLPKGTFPYFFSIPSPWLSLRTVTTSSFSPSS